MDFSLTEEEQMIVASAATFADVQLRPAERDQEAAGAVSTAVREAFAETGLADLGGGDPDLEVSWPARVQTVMELAAGDGAATLALWTRAWLVPAARGAGVEVQPDAIQLVPDLDGVTWPLPCLPLAGGEKLLVLDAQGAWGVARVEAQPVRSLGLAAASPARCALGEWLARGQTDAAPAACLRAQTRLWAAAVLVGIARASRDYTARYVQERVTFGKVIAHHQGVAFLFAEMATMVQGAELLTLKAAWDLEHGRSEQATDAYLEAVESALEVTNRGVQLLGGHGYMKDHPVEKWMRDARALSLLWGGVDAALGEPE